MGKVSTRAAKRVEIMRIGAALFKEVGYEAATVDEIARRAEMDRATLYYYFKGKQELFREMVNMATSSNVSTAEEIAALDEAPDVRLRKLIRALFESYQQHFPYLYVYLEQDINRLAQDQSAWSTDILALNDRFNKAVVRIISDGRKAGLFSSRGSDKILAAGVLGMCNWSHRWFSPNGRLSASEIAEIFADMVLGGLVGTGARAAKNAPKKAAASSR
ncbi:TetR/AcrR family transcriptional regulator [Sphingomonas sp. CGMCC 1.13654]|uniref:TetR/AcrR family transcriptional regulator n=1 Tax=Sphingomonas chungangi TaxID=2683589 RepID=A0A838L8D5_9SPHN|nr:TetR/AcrR family transcriptional regulator [Sphingomonas chungangi]MBA2935287.1 TetR/AcrR family transcriptional regulator [Sphingomonas chungangi]MVW56794.1 TetR family transcriptional regulator [Sphingomonas chungangi]